MAGENGQGDEESLAGVFDSLPRTGEVSLLDHDLFQRLRRTNLNLLPILAAVLETGRIGQAARELNLTQPAVSQALRQLRTIFDDDLVVMAGRVPTLTDRTADIIGPLRQLLVAADQLLRDARAFDPDHEALSARIVTADYVCGLLTPPLLEICRDHAASHRVDFVGVDIKRMEDLSQIDMVILPRPLARRLGQTNGSMPVFEDRFVCIAASHSALPDRIVPDHLRSLPQLRFALDAHFPANTQHLISPATDWENEQGWAFESYTVLALTIAQSDRVAVVPALLARWISAMAPIRVIEIEGPARRFHLDAIWSAQCANRQSHRWLREIIARAAATVQANASASSSRGKA